LYCDKIRNILMFSTFQMESELERYHKQNMQLELNINELRQKLKSAETEILRERQKVRCFCSSSSSYPVLVFTVLRLSRTPG